MNIASKRFGSIVRQVRRRDSEDAEEARERVREMDWYREDLTVDCRHPGYWIFRKPTKAAAR